MLRVSRQLSPSRCQSDGVALVELVIVLPVLLMILAVVVVLNSYFHQKFWFEQTAYNASLYSSQMQISDDVSERNDRTKTKAMQLSGAHRYEQRSHLIDFSLLDGISATGADPIVANNTPSDPYKRLSETNLTGVVKRLVLFGVPIRSSVFAASLSPLPVFSATDRFCGSIPGVTCNSNYGDPGCCGEYSGTTVSCVVGQSYPDCGEE